MRFARRQLLLCCISASAAALPHTHGGHHYHHTGPSLCAHEATQRKTGGVRNLGYFFNTHVSYSDEEHGRHLEATSWAPIRIQLEYVPGATSEVGVAKEAFLKETLLPAAQEWLQNALLVAPVSGALKASRNCAQFWSLNDKCAEEAPTTCGVAPDGSDYALPAAVLAELEVCSSSPASGCSTSAAGAGVANADFMLFVSSVSTDSCSGGTLAYASTCQRDGTGAQDWHGKDRPIVGYANFCPDGLDTAAAEWATQKSTAVHEILHALGFSSGSWPLFRNSDGSPMTPREDDGLPALVSAGDMDCTNGSPSTENELEVSPTTLEVKPERGTTVTRLLTPRARSVARDIFGCATLRGPELENSPTTAGACIASHWDQRLMMHELMAPMSSHTAVYSALTLAALEDSGWYKANYTFTEPLLWGRGQGCAFVQEKCVGGAAGTQHGFCETALAPSAPHPASSTGCTPGHRAKGYCDLEEVGTIPEQYRYISGQPTMGGTSHTADYCPHFNAWSNGQCGDSNNAPATKYFPAAAQTLREP